MFRHAEFTSLELADELISGGGSHEVGVLVDAGMGIVAIDEVQAHVALFPGQLEELRLARMTRVEDSPDDHDLGPFDADPLPDVGGRELLGVMNRDALVPFQSGLKMEICRGPEVVGFHIRMPGQKQADATVSGREQLGAHRLHRVVIIMHDAVEGGLDQIVAQLHHRETPPVEIDAVGRAEVRRDEEAVDVSRGEDAGKTLALQCRVAEPEGGEQVAPAHRPVPGAAEHHAVGRVRVGPAARHFRVHADKGDGGLVLRFAAAHSRGHQGGDEGIRPVAETFGDALDLLAPRRGQPWTVAQGEGYGRAMNPRRRGDLLHRGWFWAFHPTMSTKARFPFRNKPLIVFPGKSSVDPMTTPTNTDRRRFLGSLATASGVLSSPSLFAAEGTASTGFLEAARDLPINTDADVIVCGAGPAGVTAAITAARAGAKVRLFEVHGSLGGVWTSSLLGYLLDFDKPGFNVELVRRLREREAINGGGMNGLSYQPEEMKLLLEELCAAAGVKVLLHTRVAAAYREGGSLRTIVTESKSGRQAWRAPVFIDTTGDGDLGAQAGCEFEIGREKACPCQPMTMYALLVVKDAAQIAGFIHGVGDNGRHVGPQAFRDELKRAGVTPSYGSACLFPIQGNLVLLMANHEYGINATDAAQVTEATLRARGEIHQLVRGLRKLGGPWDGLQVAATPEQIGIRDGRRIRGRYLMTSEDLVQGAVQDDAVVRVTFPVDIHALSAEENKKAAYHNAGVKMKPYDIPLRALIARDVDGLLMAGRCISGDFISHASYRVTGNAVAMGEATGAAAAVAAKNKTAPHDVPWSEVRPVIEKTRNQG